MLALIFTDRISTGSVCGILSSEKRMEKDHLIANRHSSGRNAFRDEILEGATGGADVFHVPLPLEGGVIARHRLDDGRDKAAIPFRFSEVEALHLVRIAQDEQTDRVLDDADKGRPEPIGTPGVEVADDEIVGAEKTSEAHQAA